MPAIPIPNLGKVGLIKDLPPAAVPMGGLTRAENIRYTGQGLTRSGAWLPLVPTSDTDHTRKLLRHILPTDVEELYDFKERGAIYRTVGDTWEDVKPADHVDVTGDSVATSASLALLPYFTAENYPVVGRAFGPDTKFTKVMAGTPHENSTWRIVRAHKDRLFVFNETTVGNVHPQRAQWSAPVGNRELATEWDTGSLDSTSGWADMVGFRGEILDAYPLGEYMYVYGAQGVSRMWESGDDYIFNNAPVISEDGILGTHCVVPVSEFGHFVVGRNQIYIFDGQQAHPIALNRVEDEFRRTLDDTKLEAVFVYPDYKQGEIWLCYPSTDTAEAYFPLNSGANRALVWDYKHDAWSFRDLPNVVDMVTWAVLDNPLAWEDMTSQEWGAASGSWAGSAGTFTQLPAAATKVFTGPDGSVSASILRHDHTAKPTAPYNATESLIARDGLDFKEVGMLPWTTKHLRRGSFLLEADASAGENVMVGFSTRVHHQGDVTTHADIEYDPVTMTWVNTRLMGQSFGYTIEVEGNAHLNLTGIILEVEEIAQR